MQSLILIMGPTTVDTEAYAVPGTSTETPKMTGLVAAANRSTGRALASYFKHAGSCANIHPRQQQCVRYAATDAMEVARTERRAAVDRDATVTRMER